MGLIHPGIRKAWEGTQVMAIRQSQRFADQLAKIHAYSHLEGANGMPNDELVIDSPTTHYHVEAANPWPWIVLAVLTFALLGLGGLMVLRGLPVNSSGPVVQPAPGQPTPKHPQDYIEFFKP